MLGVLAGAAVGILVNMIFAYATVTLCAEQIVYGMAINIFAPAWRPSSTGSTSAPGPSWCRWV